MDDPFADTDHSREPFNGDDWARSRAQTQWLIKVYTTVETIHSIGKLWRIIVRVGIPLLLGVFALGYYMAASGWIPQ